MTLTEAAKKQQYERFKQWKAANLEKYTQQQKDHYQANKTKRNQYSKDYYEKNKLRWKIKYQKLGQ